MKIKIINNTTKTDLFNSITNKTKQVVYFGFGGSSFTLKNDSWVFKLIRLIENKIQPTPISEDEQQDAIIVADTLKEYVKSRGDNGGIFNREKIKIQFNYETSPIQDFCIKKENRNAKRYSADSFYISYRPFFKNRATIIIGVSSLTSSCNTILNRCKNPSYKKSDLSSFMALHEIGHYELNRDDNIRIKHYTLSDKFGIKEQDIDHLMSENLKQSMSETYADVFAILTLFKLKYSFGQDKFKNLLEMVFDFRKEYGTQGFINVLKTRPSNIGYSFLCASSHYTLPGLTYLKDIFSNEIKNTDLSIKRIRQIAEEIMHVGAARKIITAFSVQNGAKDIFKNYNGLEDLLEKTKLGQFAGKDWIASHKNMLLFLKVHGEKIKYPLDRLVWEYHFDGSTYQEVKSHFENKLGIRMPNQQEGGQVRSQQTRGNTKGFNLDTHEKGDILLNILDNRRTLSLGNKNTAMASIGTV